MNKIFIIGAGGFAKEVFFLLKDFGIYEICGFIDVKPQYNSIKIGNETILIIDEDDFFTNYKDVSVCVGTGYPKIIKQIVEKYKNYIFPNILHPSFIGNKEVEYIKFDNNEKKPIKDKIMSLKIASFNLNILHTLIILIKIRVDDDNEWNDTLYKLLNGYVAFRNYYFKKNKSNTYSDTIFEGFVVDCVGETVDPERETRLIRKSRRKMGKPIMFRYEPETEKKSDKKSEDKKTIKYIFLNSSGNSIKKESNLKLYEKNKHKRIEEELDDEVNSEDS